MEPVPTSRDEVVADGAPSEDAFRALLARLSRQSVVKHFDAYADIAWDAPEHAIDPEDPRFAMSPDTPLGGTDWYRALPPHMQGRIGLDAAGIVMKRGIQVEAFLQQGLLNYATRLPRNAPEFRYCYHEIVEEAQHSLMFQEFVNRAGTDFGDVSESVRRVVSATFHWSARNAPELLFVMALGAEEPFDYVQRDHLASSPGRHPLLDRIIRFHVMEEARHLSFAYGWLRNNVPGLPPARKRLLRVLAPFALGKSIDMIGLLPPTVERRYAIPEPVVRSLFRRDMLFGPARRAEAVARIRGLCTDLGIATAPWDRLWRRYGLWAPPPA